MSYITRDSAGNIAGLFACQQYGGQEFLDGATLYVAPHTHKQKSSQTEAGNHVHQFTKPNLLR